jgi:hypothetical protein
MLSLPFFNELKSAERILIAGAGGGFDVFCGLPLYFGLIAEGKTVFLANLSFTNLPLANTIDDARISPTLLKVTAETKSSEAYFPEKHLAEWFKNEGRVVPIYCFKRSGVKQLLTSYQILVEQLAVDTIILVDGGTDSLMRGDEVGLGTPEEDACSIVAVNQLKIPRKLIVCLGFGVDHYHGVNHEYFLEAVAEMTRTHGYLGMFSLTSDMKEVSEYRRATEAVFQSMPSHISIVSNSVLSSLSGEYGDQPVKSGLRKGTVWINPLMPVYWCFQLAHVAQRILYKDVIQNTTDFLEVVIAIESWRKTFKNFRPKRNIEV